jgi:hypothetical protein
VGCLRNGGSRRLGDLDAPVMAGPSLIDVDEDENAGDDGDVEDQPQGQATRLLDPEYPVVAQPNRGVQPK